MLQAPRLNAGDSARALHMLLAFLTCQGAPPAASLGWSVRAAALKLKVQVSDAWCAGALLGSPGFVFVICEAFGCGWFARVGAQSVLILCV